MKLILKIIIILFLFIKLSFSLETNWIKITKGENGHTFFIDENSLIEEEGYIYFWELINYNKPDEFGDLSAKIYIKGDCKNFRFRWRKLSYHKKTMAKDEQELKDPSYLVSDWQYPSQSSASKTVLDHACNIQGVFL